MPASLETNGVYLDRNWASFALRVKSTAKNYENVTAPWWLEGRSGPLKSCKCTHLNLAHTQLVSDPVRYSWAAAVCWSTPQSWWIKNILRFSGWFWQHYVAGDVGLSQPIRGWSVFCCLTQRHEHPACQHKKKINISSNLSVAPPKRGHLVVRHGLDTRLRLYKHPAPIMVDKGNVMPLTLVASAWTCHSSLTSLTLSAASLLGFAACGGMLLGAQAS